MMLTYHGEKRVKSRMRKEVTPTKTVQKAAKYGITYDDMPEGKLKSYVKSKICSTKKHARIIAYNQMIFVLDRYEDKVITAYKAPVAYIKDIDDLCSQKKKRIDLKTQNKNCKTDSQHERSMRLLKKNSNRI